MDGGCPAGSHISLRLQSWPVFVFQVGEWWKSTFTKIICSKGQQAHQCFCCQLWKIFLAWYPELGEWFCFICFWTCCQWTVQWADPPLSPSWVRRLQLWMETVSMSSLCQEPASKKFKNLPRRASKNHVCYSRISQLIHCWKHRKDSLSDVLLPLIYV